MKESLQAADIPSPLNF